MSIKTFKVGFAQFPGNSSTRPEPPDWVMRTVLKCKKDKRIQDAIWTFNEGDTPITMVRNKCVFEAIRDGVDYLLMIDSDMDPDYLVGYDPHSRPFWDVAWEFMVDRRKREKKEGLPYATIAAPYCCAPPHESPMIFKWTTSQSDNPNPDHRLLMMSREEAAVRSGIEQVEALPTGLILYDVRVFKRLEELGGLPWFDYEWTDKYQIAKASTEDVFQTRNANMAGMPQFVAWDCWAVHNKNKRVGKPVLIYRDDVHACYREAIQRELERGETVQIIAKRGEA
jgi:hypothetical protein